MEADGEGETSREQLLAALNDRLDQFLSGDTAVLGEAGAHTVADALGAVPGNLETAYALGLFHHYRLTAGLAGPDRGDAARALGYFAAVFRQAPDLVPEGVRELVQDRWKRDGDDVSTWRLRAQQLLQDPRRFRLPDLFSDAIYLLQLTLGTGMLSLQAQAASMTSLVIAYAGRFEATGDLTALDGAADAAARCVEVTEPADPNLPGRRSNLAAALATRFDHTGAMEDLEQAIAQLWIAVDAAAPDERPGYLANLGGALLLRYQHSGDTASLNQAVECGRTAVSGIDAGYRQRPRMLGTLALALRTRFQRRGHRPDIDAAVDAIEQAVQATEAGHPDEAGYLSALSTALRVRFGASEAASDIDRAVKAARAAAHAAQGDSDVRVKSLSNLGAALSARFRMGEDPADLDDAVTAQAEAAELASPGDPVRATILANLGLSLRQRAGHSQNRRDDLRPAARAYATSGAVDGAPAIVRATSSYDAGVILAELEDWPAAVEQFQRSVECLSAVVDHRLDRDDRQHHLSRISGLGSEAAAVALRAGITPAAALELMERARGVLLAQAIATRSGLADLRTQHPAVADRFDNLTRTLEVMSDDTIDRGGGRLRHRRQQERERLLREIRELPGFGQFLLPAKDPLSLSLPGPAVVINVARSGCDAFIIVGGDVTCVPLPAVTYQDARKQANALLAAVNGDGWEGNERLRAVLGWAWDTIMEPIFHHLDTHAALAAAGLRVWWIPTGPLTMLPLHAAGRPDTPGNSVLEQVVSSYAPTVRSLAHAFLDQPTFVDKDGQRALVVAVPSAAGHTALPEAAAEADEVAGSLSAAGREPVDALTGADASRAEVITRLRQSTWAHFACHAATSGNPADSHLVLHDGDLTVREISALHINHADLAYLSACTTAFGGTDLVDEAIHITSAFQLAGFRHVIGTLWKVEDAAARTMARETYALLANSATAADAIHEAVRRLRERYPRNPRIWAAYLHVGL